MQLIKMKCNNCNAQLEVDLDNLQFYCPYCKQKLMMDFEMLAWVLAEKEKTKRVIEHEQNKTRRSIEREEHITLRKKMEYDYNAREKASERKSNTFVKVVPYIFAAIIGVLLPVLYFGSEIKKHEERVEYLQQLELEIEEDINNEDFDSAFNKANRLVLDDNYSSEETKTWEKRRKTIIKTIEEKKRETDIKNPRNIFMPASSAAFKGKNYNDVVKQLRENGFTSIVTQASPKKSGILNKKDTVEHILVGGTTDFTEKSYFDKDTPIIVYYYN